MAQNLKSSLDLSGNNYIVPKGTSGNIDTTTLNDIDNGLYRYLCEDNYIYLHHLGIYIILPVFADKLNDTMNVSFVNETPLSRSAPIYSFSSSGPRIINFTFNLHRELMKQINYGQSNLKDKISGLSEDLGQNGDNDDYIDVLINYIQGGALPEYHTSGKMVDPPLVSVRMGRDIYIKGVIQGAVSVTYGLPILRDGRYACVDISFSVAEVDPFSASDAATLGHYRGNPATLEGRLWLTSDAIKDEPIQQFVTTDENASIVPQGDNKPKEKIFTEFEKTIGRWSSDSLTTNFSKRWQIFRR